jgi:NADH-quinone oxidoreductase subunit E
MDSVYDRPFETGRADVVVIDDEESIREGCRETLESEGYRAIAATDGMEGLRLVKNTRPRVVLLDLRMPGISGVEVLEKLPGIDPRIIPIIITGYGTIDSAVETMKLGAFDFITKPFDMDQLLGVVDRGMRRYESVAPPVEAVRPSPEVRVAPSEADVLLDALESLGQYYSLGVEGRTLASELRALEAEAQYHSEVLGRIRDKEKAITELAADLRMVNEIIERHEFKKNALIQILLDIQSQKNWLPRHALLWIARRLNIPMTQILQVASFYEAFSLEPQGKHIVQVCMGTACHVRNAPEFLAVISSLLGIEPGQTDERMLFTLKTVHCFGCCALAPVMRIDDVYHSNPTLKQLRAIFKRHEGEQVDPCQN